MIVVKRNGNKVKFEQDKIKNAMSKAFKECAEEEPENMGQLLSWIIESFGDSDSVDVEDIQDAVEDVLMASGYFEVAKAYIRYRYLHGIQRQSKNDAEFLSLIKGDNDYWYTENSNKNAVWVTTQRDYLAGITSKDLARNYIFPKNIMDAHDAGIIHIHDLDYAAQNTLTNCCLVNLDDMLQNGTVINGVKIDKPHRLITAATLASQIIAAVASSQYGGTSISLTHLAPFVRDSYNQYKKKYQEWGLDSSKCEEFAVRDTKKEIRDATQTLIYQLNSLTTTNG